MRGSEVLDSEQVSGSSPTVAITSPNEEVSWPAGTTQTISWTGDDADGDTLTYSVLYSHNDGASWDLLVTGLISTSHTVEVDAFAGSSKGRFRVVATDGINIGIAEAPAVTIPDKAPVAVIIEPLDGRVEQVGGLVVLQGSALDLEEGRLADGLLRWSSDLDGELGVGSSLPVNTLQAGEHTITLSTADSKGNTGSASVTLVVGDRVYLPSVSR